MKTFLLYNAPSVNSTRIANECLKSFQAFSGWPEVELYDGCNANTLSTYEEKYPLPIEKNNKFKGHNAYNHKKSCFYSHYSLWHKCYENNEPIVIVEHDTECCGDFPQHDFEDGSVIQLTTGSIMGQGNPFTSLKFKVEYEATGKGLHKIWYKHPHGHYGMAGCTGYIMTPKAAKIYIDICAEDGWMQNDLLIRSDYTPLYYVSPNPMKWIPAKETQTSSKGLKQ